MVITNQIGWRHEVKEYLNELLGEEIDICW